MKISRARSAFIRHYTSQCSVDSCDYSRLLRHCKSLKGLEKIHAQIIVTGLQQNPFLASKLVSQYAEHLGMGIARKVFEAVRERDVLLWNVVIRGYADKGPFVEAIKVYHHMRSSGICPNRYTFPFVLKACAAIGGRKGKEIHGHIMRAGLWSDLFVANALVALYAKCRDIQKARRLFDEICDKDLVSWNSMIAGYSQNEQMNEALELFHQMVGEDSRIMPDRVTLVTVLPVCAHLAAIQEGMWIHLYIIKSGIEIDVALGSGLVGTYAKCGRLETACLLFAKIAERNVVVWNMMIGGFGMHGHAAEAVEMFFQMVETGVCPDDISFVTVISACSHAGMVDRGLEFFKMMERFSVERTAVHYSCVVDLLGRAGRLTEAFEFIEKMPVRPGKDAWGALLGACRIHGKIELAELAAERLFVLDPDNAGRYVALAKMYEDAGRMEDVARVRKLMRERRIKKQHGCSTIEVDCVLHIFGVDDDSHPMAKTIYDTLEHIEMEMK
ncbi:pentatricopeptide repeat-containing protein At5g48910-like [Aristolochia californica]|uniref:pentatricopeptide repeat-containing protein At5g48910-like n=1 Tax=Aristolochia californica TaxID=171875 RepID=UPI0035E2A192